MKSSVDKQRNSITEPKNNYKLYNPYMIDGYAAITPSSLSKISMVIFNSILSNKRYHKESSTAYSETEARRIYNTVLVTPEYILQQCNPSKYSLEPQKIQQDISNLIKKLNELENNNVFYIWRAGFPHVYVFYMERDIGAWKFFNSKGVVTPKTLRKIIRTHKQSIENMLVLLKTDNQNAERAEIENSFGFFINNIIDKMNPLIGNNLSRWKGNGSISDFISHLTQETNGMEEFDGLEQDENFTMKLPPTIKNKLLPKNKGETKMDTATLEKELVPENENLTKTRKTTRKRISKNFNGVIVAPIESFASCNPFANCNEFITFYKEIIRLQHPEAKFTNPDSQRKIAAEILDTLILENKNNRRFLKGWIAYFAKNKLSIQSASNRSKTSLEEFSKTLREFSTFYSELV